MTPTPYLAYTKPLSHGPWIPWQEACYEESFIINTRWIPDVTLHLTDEDPELLSIQVAMPLVFEQLGSWLLPQMEAAQDRLVF